MNATQAQPRFKCLTTDATGMGGFYGCGESIEAAMEEARKACGSKREWKRQNRQVVVDLETGEEVYRVGKR